MKKIIVITLLAAVTLSSCGKFSDIKQTRDSVKIVDLTQSEEENSETDASKTEIFETEDLEPEESSETSSETQEASEVQENTESSTSRNSQDSSLFQQIEGYTFTFASGVGGWGTELYIHADGTFEGNYHDSELGITGPDYPDGTMYYSDFSGKFSTPEKINDYTYKFEMDSITYANKVGTEETIDNIHYIYAEAYGLNDSEYFYMYLPGTPLDHLSEDFLSWVGFYNLLDDSDTTLPFYALHNVKPDYGFSGYKPSSAADLAEASLSSAKKQAEELEHSLEAGDLCQSDMNDIANQLYTVWDESLNYIWSLLKDNLSEAEMNTLLTEQRAWISEKEKAAKDAGAEFEGGSMQPFIENTTAADYSRKRAYELADYLK